MKTCLLGLGAALVRSYYRALYRVQVIGRDELKQLGESPLIIAGNHISMNDPVLLSAFLGPHIQFMAKEELFRVPGLCWILRKMRAFPVARRGIGIGAIRHALRILEEGGVVGIFPEGTRNYGGPMRPAKPGVGFLAVKRQVAILPVAITLQPRRIFRRNYIVIGEPIQPAEVWTHDYRALARHVLASVAQLMEEADEFVLAPQEGLD
jgi:1-acyl-sn-glycerol-3-phosphate acyltransferase